MVSGKGYIGFNSGSIGEATVTGAGSQWNNSGNLLVGYEGDGVLNVEAGGMVSLSRDGSILGVSPGSTGLATITGSIRPGQTAVGCTSVEIAPDQVATEH